MFRSGTVMLFVLVSHVAAAASPFSTNAHPPPSLDTARALILEGKGREAWSLLEPHEFRLAGNVDYDYLLGVAAIEAGLPDRATLALERVLAVNPRHAAARLDMGRAYFALGDYDRARTEFLDLLAHDPPPAARDTIERYLTAIDIRTRRAGAFRATGYIEASGGYDSNINAGVSQGALFLPLFGATFALAPEATRQDDHFFAFGAGVEALAPLSDTVSFLAGADIRQRTYSSHDAFDYQATDVRAGLQYADAVDSVRIMLGTNRYDLDYARYRRVESIGVDWRHQLDRHTQYSIHAQRFEIRYLQPATLSQSSDLQIIGASLIHTLHEPTRSFGFATISAGSDKATDQRIDGDRRIYGVRLGVQSALTGDADWYTALGIQKSDYNRENPIFGAHRRDWQYDLTLGINWRFAADWSLRPQASYTRNDSTIAINHYDRYELSVTLRRDWR